VRLVSWNLERRQAAYEHLWSELRAAAKHATLVPGDPEILDRADRIPCAVTDARA
jgi:hypothetical protein